MRPAASKAHVMIKLLRRRLREHYPELMDIPLPAARLQRALDMLAEIWARAGDSAGKHPIWRLVEGLLRLARDHSVQAKPDGDQSPHDQGH